VLGLFPSPQVDLIDEVISVSDEDAIAYGRLAREKGYYLAYLPVRRCAAIRVAQRPENQGADCTDSASFGERYLSTPCSRLWSHGTRYSCAKVVKWQIQPLRHLTYSSCCYQRGRLNNLSSLGKAISSDSNQETANHEQIIRINAARGIKGCGWSAYDQELSARLKLPGVQQQNNCKKQYRASRQTGRDADEQRAMVTASLSTSQSFAVEFSIPRAANQRTSG